jgi:hypothetical protein
MPSKRPPYIEDEGSIDDLQIARNFIDPYPASRVDLVDRCVSPWTRLTGVMTAQRERYSINPIKRSVDRDEDDGALKCIDTDCRCNASYEF